MPSGLDPSMVIYCSALAPVLSLEAVLSDSSDTETSPLEIPAPMESVEDLVEAAHTAKAIRKFMYSLSPRRREILWRLFWQGESQASVANRLGVTRSAISKDLAKVLSAGRRRLARCAGCCLLT